jgi:nitrous oxidase accessory protein NosD
MLTKKPQDRYRTAGDVAAALEPFTRAGGRPERKRNQPAWLVVAAVLFFTLAILGLVIHHIRTDKGELIITTESNDVEVVVKKGGKVVRIIDTKTDQDITLVLDSGVYELELKGAPKGLKLNIAKATLMRGKTVLAKVVQIKAPAPPPRLVVCPNGKGQYKTLTEAVAHAKEGMRLLIRPGVYRESLDVTKRLHIEGENKALTVIESTTGSCLTLDADGIEVRSLTLRCRAGKESGKAALLVTGGKKILVEDCDITTDASEPQLGSMSISGSETEVTARHCRFVDGATQGVYLTAKAKVTLEHCESSRNKHCGIWSRGGILTARQCKLRSNKALGVALNWTEGNLVEGCDILDNGDVGLEVIDGCKVSVRHCKILSNGSARRTSGIHCRLKSEVEVRDCTIERNAATGVWVVEGSKAVIRDSRLKGNRDSAVAVERKGYARVESCDATGYPGGAFQTRTEGRIERKDNKE